MAVTRESNRCGFDEYQNGRKVGEICCLLHIHIEYESGDRGSYMAGVSNGFSHSDALRHLENTAQGRQFNAKKGVSCSLEKSQVKGYANVRGNERIDALMRKAETNRQHGDDKGLSI
ncbi:hypothetical protein BsWGS_10560 [Bradybaena similaris]